MDNNNSYKGYSLFNEIEDVTLQTWNRAVTMFNINDKFNEKMAREYASHFTHNEHTKLFMMLQYIKVKGAEIVRREIMNGELRAKVQQPTVH
tara:strand:- start:13933 stop:14208 length:276 start_codon:yes stop_codon:yes gene_type:complete